MEYVKNSNDKRVKLVLFGPIVEGMKEKILPYVDGNRIQYFEWLDSAGSYGLFAFSDLAVFPGRHSVYWEQAVGSGLPIIVKYWDGTTHVDLGGNCIFLTQDTYEELKGRIDELLSNEDKYKIMRAISIQKGIERFSYRNISRVSIERNEH